MTVFEQLKSGIKSTQNKPKKQSPTRTTGNFAEELALQYLRKEKFQFVARQYSCKMGELDLIMKDKDAIVFIEVRYRESKAFGEPFESITRPKQRKLIRTALFYLKCHPWTAHFSARFDVISITGSQLTPEITWIPNAFGVQ